MNRLERLRYQEEQKLNKELNIFQLISLLFLIDFRQKDD